MVMVNHSRTNGSLPKCLGIVVAASWDVSTLYYLCFNNLDVCHANTYLQQISIHACSAVFLRMSLWCAVG